MTEPPTNLSEKFAALTTLITAQHTAMLAEIAALRGAGPENTLKSLNESVWNLAGPAPGANLAQIHGLIQAGLFTAVGEEFAPTLYAMAVTGATEPTAAAILAAIGTLASTPAGETVKTLLAQIDTDIAGISETPPDYSAAAPPAGGCGGSYSDDNYRQLSGWEITSNPTRYTATFHAAVGFITLADILIETADGNTYNALIDTGGGDTEFCATWQASGSSPRHVKWRKYTLGGGGVYSPILVDIDMTNGTASGSSEMVLTGQAIVFFVDYGEGETLADPGVQLWLKGYGAS